MVPLLLETIRIEEGKPLHLSYHQARFERTLRHFGITSHTTLSSVIVPPDATATYRCRILYDTRIRSVEYLPYMPRPMHRFKLVEADVDYNFKYADRSTFDELRQRFIGYDDLILVRNGMITDTTIANLAFFDGKRWLTPTQPLLSGTTRARLIDRGEIEPEPVTVDALSSFRGMALMNAMVGFKVIDPITIDR